MGNRGRRRPLSVNLVAWDNAGGLRTDIDILSKTLEQLGCRVRCNGRAARREQSLPDRLLNGAALRLRHAYASLRTVPLYDINLFLESIDPRFIPFGRINCLIPNPEWFRDENMLHLSRMDWVLCKTRNAVDIFRALTPRTRYLGFASVDRRDQVPQSTRDVTFLHAAGASKWKGTAAVVEAWQRHPEWPRLVLIRRPTMYGGAPIAKQAEMRNVESVTEYLDDHTWRRYQNACGVHVCPSEAEGFGHIIVEAMSCEAVVVTTDGPPMNELVTSDRGVLVRAAREAPMRLGTSYFVDVSHLEQQIARVIDMTPDARREMGQQARLWYEAQRQAFERALRTFLDEAAGESHSRVAMTREQAPGNG